MECLESCVSSIIFKLSGLSISLSLSLSLSKTLGGFSLKVERKNGRFGEQGEGAETLCEQRSEGRRKFVEEGLVQG